MLQISTSNSIIIDYIATPLSVTQTRAGTVVYTPECVATGQKYQEHNMPQLRYSLAHPKPASGNAGRDQFESDVRDLLQRLGYVRTGLFYDKLVD